MSTRIIILAAGKGARMNSTIPKALIQLHGKPILQHLMDAVALSGIDPHPAIVVGENGALIEQAMGKGHYEYIRQNLPLGTGHAVACARQYLSGGNTSAVIVLYADHPFVTAQTIQQLSSLHHDQRPAISIMTTTVEDFAGWRSLFYDFGRVIRNSCGNIRAIRELKDATDSERQIKEVNPAFFCFRTDWLWPNLKLLTNTNHQREYYLTDLVQIAIEQNELIASLGISPLQSIGINTPEQLEIAVNAFPKSIDGRTIW